MKKSLIRLSITFAVSACYASSSFHEDGHVDPDTQTDDVQPDCDMTCPEGWTPACPVGDPWCISTFRGIGNCCDALEACRAIGGWPGIWPNAGPYEGTVPPDFFESANPPAIVITYAGSSDGLSYAFNISCMDQDGNKQHGESHTVVGNDCSDAICAPYTDRVCTGNIGCGCQMPFWCYVTPDF